MNVKISFYTGLLLTLRVNDKPAGHCQAPGGWTSGKNGLLSVELFSYFGGLKI